MKNDFLFRAVKDEDCTVEILKILEKDGTDLKALNDDEWTAITVHVKCNQNPNMEIVKFLIEKGVNIKHVDNFGDGALNALAYNT